MSRSCAFVRKVRRVFHCKQICAQDYFKTSCRMSGRRRFVCLLWLACLLTGALCLRRIGGQHEGEDQVVTTVHHQQTIITMRRTAAGELIRCDTVEVNFPKEEREALAAIGRERHITSVSFTYLMNVLLECQRLDAVRRRRQPDAQAAGDESGRERWDSSTLLRGIVPGTNWCGLGDTAKGWNDLGPNDELDRCCRTHDLCPVKVKAYRRRYGLFNWGLYTKSHCACDQAFYQCLKSSSAKEADHVGRLFFDLLRPQCVQAPACFPHETADACVERQKAQDVTPTKLKFFDQPRRYDAKPRTVSEAAINGGSGGEGGGEGVGRDDAELEKDRFAPLTQDRGAEEQDRGGERPVRLAGAGPLSDPTRRPSSSSGDGPFSFFGRLLERLG